MADRGTSLPITERHLVRESAGSVAIFSPCTRYRYYLKREWAKGKPTLTYVMLNPSTADEHVNDPTVERCQRRAQALGYGSFIVTNIFAFRSTDPTYLYLSSVIPIGEDNDDFIIAAAAQAEKVVVAWGNHGKHMGRGQVVLDMLEAMGIELWCLGQNAGGEPKHPLYRSYSDPLQRYLACVI